MKHWDKYTWEAVISFTGSALFVLSVIVARWV